MGSKNQFKRYGHMKIWEKNNKNLHKLAAQKYVWLLKWSMWNDQLKIYARQKLIGHDKPLPQK